MSTENKASDLVITRTFDAPRAAVWDAWTKPERMKRWWGPKGFTAPVINIDLRVGGEYLSCMRSPEGKDFWSTGVYKEIVPQESIVYTDSFADEQGNKVSASHYGMEGDWPMVMEVALQFEDASAGTKMTLRHTGLPEEKAKKECEEGWNESLDKLAESLK